MKKTLIMLVLAFAIGYSASAQQKPQTHYMIITITSENLKLNMIVTRDDSAQVQKHLELNLKVNWKQALAAHEALGMQSLKPYFNEGWKLVSTSSELNITSGQSNSDITRFFLSKNE